MKGLLLRWTPAVVGLAASASLLLGCRAAAGLGELVAPAQPEAQGVWEAPMPPPELVHVATCAAAEEYVRALAGLYAERSPGVYVDIVVVTSELGLEMLGGGEADAAIVTRRPGDEALPGLADPDRWQAASLATDGLAVIVSSALALDELGRTGLVELFTGCVLDWADLGAGSSGVPDVVVQDASSTSRRVFDGEFLGGHSPTTAAVLVPDDRAAVAYVASHPLAVGYAASSALSPDVQTVRVQAGLSERLLSGNPHYPAALEVVLVSPVAMSREVYRLRALAASEDGRRLLEQHFNQ